MREYAIFLTLNQELADLRREELRRQIHGTGPSLAEWIVSVLRSTRTAITTPAGKAPTFTPSLSD